MESSRIKVFVIFAACIAAAVAGVPTIDSVEGNASSGLNLTVSGTGFGQKNAAEPYRASFMHPNSSMNWQETGTLDSHWSLHDAYQPYVDIQDASYRIPGKHYAHMIYNSAAGSVDPAIITSLPMTGVDYVAVWDYYEPGFDFSHMSTGRANIKAFYFNAGGHPHDGIQIVEDGAAYDGSASTGVAGDTREEQDANLLLPFGGGYYARPYSWTAYYEVPRGEWFLIEFFYNMSSTPGAQDGFIEMRIDNQRVYRADNAGIYDDPEHNTNSADFLRVAFGGNYGFDASGLEFNRYFGDIYVDGTFQRAVICENQSFADCRHLEHQIPLDWNSSSITIRFNPGSFQYGDKAYLYVFDDVNDMNPEGYELTVGEVTGHAPSISGISGELSHGTNISITGSGFGDEIPSIMLWDDFEEGTPGETLDAAPKTGTWDLNGGTPAIYSSAYSHSGAQSSYGTTSAGSMYSQFGSPASGGMTDQYYYASFWFIYDYPDGGSGQTKFIQLWGTYQQGDYNPGVMSGGFSGTWWATYIALESGGILQENYNDGEPSQNQWHHAEMILRQGTPDAEDGSVTIKIDGDIEYHQDGVKTRELVGESWERLWFFYGFTNMGDGTSKYNALDDVYLADSWARVEIGDDSNYSQCTHREIQVPTSWSADSVQITANPGSFSPGDTAYVFVVDESGTASEGYPVDIGPGYHDADLNQDGMIDNQEIQAYIINWKGGSVRIGQLFSGLSAWKGDDQ